LQGIYVLQDNSFRWLLRLALPGPPPDSAQGRSEALVAAAQPYLELPCGLIRGAPRAVCACRAFDLGAANAGGSRIWLAVVCRGDAPAAPPLLAPPRPLAGALTHLGISCTVEADAHGLPSCESRSVLCRAVPWLCCVAQALSIKLGPVVPRNVCFGVASTTHTGSFTIKITS
jgi:hypothetical protein